jgi:hypothetical protein
MNVSINVAVLLGLAALLPAGCSDESPSFTWRTTAGGAGGGGTATSSGRGSGNGGAKADGGSATSSGTGSGSGAADGGSAAPPCVPPAGPYGTRQGSVLDPSMAWQGVAAGGATTTIKLSDYYDCDGTRGVNALLIDVSAAWCGACQSEAPEVDQKLAGSWGQEGVKVLTLMIEDEGGSPATVQTAKSWSTSFGLSHVAVAADPQGTFQVTSLPTNILVDPRTMKVLSVEGSFDPSGSAVDDLARKNAH